MNRFIILTALIFIFEFQDYAYAGIDYELREKLHKALRDIPQLEEIKQKTQRSIQDVVENLRSNYQRKRHAEKGELLDNVQSFLQRIIPNSGLVQDLMGYITMPRFIKDGLFGSDED